MITHYSFSDHNIFIHIYHPNTIKQQQIQQVIFRDVSGHPGYGYGKIGVDFEVMIRKSDQFVNISKFLTKYGGNKKLNDWTKRKTGKAILKEYATVVVNPIEYDNTLHNDIRGTYVCIEIAYAVAMWVSPKYLLKMIDVIRQHDHIQHTRELAELTAAKQRIIDTKDARIGELEGEISDLEDDIEERNFRINEQDSALHIAEDLTRDLQQQTNDLQQQTNVLQQRISTLKNHISEALKDRAVPPNKSNKMCEFSIVRICEPNDDDPEGYLHYEVIRAQRQYQTERRLRNLKDQYGANNVRLILREKTTNSITFGQKFRDELGNDVDYHNKPSCSFSTFHFNDQGLIEIAQDIRNKLKKINGTQYIP